MDTKKTGTDYYNEACKLINNESKDYKTIVYLLEQGVGCGSPECMNELALLYLNGKGVKKNADLAVYYFSMADNEHNYKYAQTSLGYCYLNGIGVPTNIKKAIQFFNKAAEQGDQNALTNIEYINSTFLLNDDFSMKKSSFGRSILAMLICVLSIVASGLIALGSLWEIGNLEGLDKLIAIPACLSVVNFLCAIFIIAKSRIAFKLLAINIAVGLLFILSLGTLLLFNDAIVGANSQTTLMMSGAAFLVSLVLFGTLFIRNSHKMSFADVLLAEDHSLKMMYERGTTREFAIDSMQTKRLKRASCWSYYLISAVIIAISVYMAINIKFDFSLSGNPFDSGITLFFFFASMPFMIFQPTFAIKTFHVFLDADGNEKGRRRSDDTIDSMMEMMWPIIAKFVIMPTVIALICYGIIYLVLKVVAFLLPFLVAGLAIFLLKFVKKSLDSILYKKARARLMPLAIAFYFSLYIIAFGAFYMLGKASSSDVVNDITFAETRQEILKTDFGDKTSLQDGEIAEYAVAGKKAEDFYHFYAVFFSDESKQKERIESAKALFRYDYYDNNGKVREVIKDADFDNWDFIGKINPWDTDGFDVKSSSNKVTVIADDELSGTYKEYTFVLNQNGQWLLKEVYSKEPEPWTE